MIEFARIGAAAVLTGWLGVALAAPDEALSETRKVDGRIVRVKIEGPVDLKLRQGPLPSLVLTGERAVLAKITSDQHGDTITIATETSAFRFGRKKNGVRAELTLPALREVSSDSLGATEISGFSGDEIELKLEGAGSMKANFSYRVVNAVLGGVGRMDIDAGNAEGLELDLRGAGFMSLRGGGKWLRASLGGLGSLDARLFVAETVTLDLSGLGNATVAARQNANLSLSGLGSVTVYGKPVNRSVSVDGLGKVNWK